MIVDGKEIRQNMKKPKILLVGFFDSPHFARWVKIIAEQDGLDIFLYCSSPARTINPLLKDTILKDNVRIDPRSPKNPWFSYALDLLPLFRSRSKALGQSIAFENFDVIHYFEMQHSGYLLNGLEIPPSTRLAYSNYGSDIFWFSRKKRHEKKIQKLLSVTDVVFYECSRDISYISAKAKAGSVFIKTINSGGLEEIGNEPKSGRDKILLKGYSNRWGKAVWALIHLLRMSKTFRDEFTLVVYSCDYHVPFIAKVLCKFMRVRVETHVKGRLTRQQVLELFEQALIHIAISKSDGVPSSTLEAMRGGAIPVQSKTACMEDWIMNGINGYLIDINSTQLMNSVRDILSEPAKINSARVANRLILAEKNSEHLIEGNMRQGYEHLLK